MGSDGGIGQDSGGDQQSCGCFTAHGFSSRQWDSARVIARNNSFLWPSFSMHPPGRCPPAVGWPEVEKPLALQGHCSTVERRNEDRKSTRLNSSHANLVCRLLLEKKKNKGTCRDSRHNTTPQARAAWPKHV